MAIKKKVTYSVQYVAGTDTLTTQLNLLLQDIVSLILSQNTGLTVLDTITVGSSRWTGAPLFDTYVSGLYSSDYQNRHYQSDVYFLGTNEDNVCLSLVFFDNNLVVAMNMTPKVEKSITDNWSNYGLGSYVPLYAIGKMSRWFNDVRHMGGNYAIPYIITNNTITLSVIYWTGDFSRGYSFVDANGQSDGVDLVIFNTDEGNNVSSLGAAIWSKGTINAYRNGLAGVIFTFSFNENLLDNAPTAIPARSPSNPSGYIYPGVTVCQECNARYDWRVWFNAYNSTVYHDGLKLFACYHSLGGIRGRIEAAYGILPLDDYPVNATWDVTEADDFLSALMMPYNLPHLNVGQAYVRKMRIPGWNPSCKGEIYLLWSPVTSGYKSGDIVEVGSKSYAIITEGAICWAARVS